MRFCVYGAASSKIDDKYIKATEELGRVIAGKGHSIVFGGGASGVMGAVARGVQEKGGSVLAVIPRFFQNEDYEPLFEESDQIIYTYTMSERKTKMEDAADAFIIAPGGIGTYDEFFEALTLYQLGRHRKPIALFNVDGFYNPLIEMLKHADSENFLRPGVIDTFKSFDDPTKIVDYLYKEANAQ